jgi:hypothetical protein
LVSQVSVSPFRLRGNGDYKQQGRLMRERRAQGFSPLLLKFRRIGFTLTRRPHRIWPYCIVLETCDDVHVQLRYDVS